MNQTDTMADVRSFFTPKPKTETYTVAEATAWFDGLPEEGRKIVLKEVELEEAYRQGFKDAEEEYSYTTEKIIGSFEFEPSLVDIADRRPTMSLWVTDDTLIYRFPKDEELDEVIWRGPLFRFPIGWAGGDIKYVTYRAGLTGTTWTRREFLERAELIYTAQKRKHLKAMGDHIFFEGFVGDTFHCGS
jgi:hypothetical protein